MPSSSRRPATWSSKFAAAFSGLKQGVHGQSSFFVHFFATVLVIVAAIFLRASLAEWCLLVLCIQSVLVAEMFNSAVEWLARTITRDHDEQLGVALDIASAAVLVAAVGAAVIGIAVFLHRVGVLLAWWPAAI
jgi:diacylglycerol kinase